MSIYGNNILEYRYQIVNEAYFGKTDTLMEIEQQIGIIRQNALKKLSDINRSAEVQKLNRLFEKQFGMEVFALHIERNEMINAYTVPVARRFDVAFKDDIIKKVAASKSKGYYFTPGNNLCIICNIYLGLLKCESITDEEIVAVILHELGHNFADAINDKIAIANYNFAKSYFYYLIFYGIIMAIRSFGLTIPKFVSAYRSNLNKVNVKREKRTRKRIFEGLFKTIKATTDDINSTINSVVYRLLYGGSYLRFYKKIAEKQKVPEKVRQSTDRINEVIADKFCGIYGYGLAQASALAKMNKQVSRASQITSKIPFIGKQRNDDYEAETIDLSRFDCHPAIIQRLNSEINLLQAEINKNDIDPKLQDSIEKQIEQMKKLRDNIMKVTNEMSKNEKLVAEYNKYVNDHEPNPLDDKVEEEIHKSFDELISED